MTTIEYLQRELRRVELSMRRAAKKPNTPPEELRGLHEKLEHLQEALEAVDEHWQRVHEQRGWMTGEPLTLEQLRGMDGQPVYWPDDESWGIVSVDDSGRWAGIPFFRGRKNGVNFEYDIVSRGMEVYAYPPAHIDREKWEPCEHCKPHENALDRWGPHQFPIDDGAIYYYDVDDGWEGEEINFCPWCGRPLTEEAWAELERRCLG